MRLLRLFPSHPCKAANPRIRHPPACQPQTPYVTPRTCCARLSGMRSYRHGSIVYVARPCDSERTCVALPLSFSCAAQQGDERIDVVEVDVTVGVAVAVEPVAARVGDVPGQRVGTERGDEGVDVIKIDVAVAILDLGLRILDWSDGAT